MNNRFLSITLLFISACSSGQPQSMLLIQNHSSHNVTAIKVVLADTFLAESQIPEVSNEHVEIVTLKNIASGREESAPYIRDGEYYITVVSNFAEDKAIMNRYGYSAGNHPHTITVTDDDLIVDQRSMRE